MMSLVLVCIDRSMANSTNRWMCQSALCECQFPCSVSMFWLFISLLDFLNMAVNRGRLAVAVRHRDVKYVACDKTIAFFVVC